MKKVNFVRSALLVSTLLAAMFGHAADSQVIPTQKVNQALHDKLPAEIRNAGEMVFANDGSFPPYMIVISSDLVEGASADLAKAVGEILDIKVKHMTVGGLSPLLTGLKSGRYQIAVGPVGDFPARQKENDFIDFVQEYVVFAVKKGNPNAINSLNDTCGHRIAVASGGSAERVIKEQAERCEKEGRPALQVQSFKDQPTSILAVRSNRSDAFFSSQASLIYFISQSNGELELSGIGEKNGFSDLYQGTVVPKGSVLGPIVLEAYQELFANGTYAIIMKKWGLEHNMLKAPAINLAGKE